MSSLGRQLADIELRNARTMRSAQSAWDNAEPPEPDESMSEMEARDLSETEALTTPHFFADWLAAECKGHESPVDLWALRESFTSGDVSLCDLPAPTLLALAVGCYDYRVSDRALSHLRDRYLAAQAEWIGERADELLKDDKA